MTALPGGYKAGIQRDSGGVFLFYFAELKIVSFHLGFWELMSARAH